MLNLRYKGLERVLSFFNKKSADRKRLERINKQSPKENLKQILDFAEQLYSEIVATRTDAINTYNRLEANGDVIVGKIDVFEPQESALKEQLDTLEEAYKNKDAEYKKASAQRQAELVTQLNTDHRRLTQLRNEYDQILTVYSQAQQAIESNHQSRNAFEQMVRDLGRQATMLREKVDNVTEIYSAAPEAVKIMMTTKGMEEMDKAMNVGTDKSVDMITRAAYSVSSATLAREEVQLIDEQVMRGYSDRMREMADMFEQRFGGIRISAQKSREERYKKQ
jgi:uncharacterized phage infection (PIP) family protein YhgE